MGWSWWNTRLSQKGVSISLEMHGSRQVTMGQVEEYEATWKNQTQTTLHDVDLGISLPSDFILLSTDPPTPEQAGGTWHIAEIPPHAFGSVRWRGWFQGALGTSDVMQMTARIPASGGQTERLSLASLQVVQAHTNLDATWTFPQVVTAGQLVSFQYTIMNRSATTLSGVHAHVQWPKDFEVLSSNGTALATGQQDVTFPTLAPQASSTQSFTGMFSADSTGERTFKADVGLMQQGNLAIASRTSGSLSVVNDDLTLQPIVHGSSQSTTIKSGDTLHLALRYQNAGAQDMDHISLLLGLETLLDGQSTSTSLVDTSHIRGLSPVPMFSQQGGLVTFRYDETGNPDFQQLASHAGGVIDLALPMLPAPTGTHDAAIRLTLQGGILRVGGHDVRRIVHAQPILLSYASQFELTAEARYFSSEGVPVGTGPLPPQAGTSTTYRIFWHAHKTLHELQDGFLQATLPLNVAWANGVQVEQGNVVYDPLTRLIRWTIPNLPSGTQDVQASFLLTVTPQTMDRGRFAQLLQETHGGVTDGSTSEQFSASADALNTDLTTDDFALGEGLVR